MKFAALRATLAVLWTKLVALALWVKVPRPMQQEAYNKFRSARHKRLIGPPGSGKTFLIQMIALVEMLFEGRRTLIAVPQRNIGRGFGGFKGRVARVWIPCQAWTGPAFAAAALACVWLACWHWSAALLIPPLWLLWRRLATRRWTAVNKCWDAGNAIDEVEAFIRGGKGIMVCCHASLARAWRRISKEDAARIRDLSLWIDEAHFVSAADRRNGVGEMVHALVRGDESVRVGLATATFCRGDGEDIVHPDDIREFVTYDAPFDRHFRENMPSVEGMEFDYIPYDRGAGWDGPLEEWLRKVGPHALVYVPHPGSILASPDSPDGKPGKIVDLERATAAIRRADHGADIIDLVTDRNNGGDNSEEMRTFEERIAAGGDPGYVVALNLMKVGSDWPNLRSVADLAPSGSAPDGGQKFGRLAREPSRGVDKRVISYGSFFPTLDRRVGEATRRMCSERLISLISLLLLHYAVETVALFRRKGGGGGGGGGNPATNHPRIAEFLTTLASRMGGSEHGTCVEEARRLMDEMGILDDGIRAGLEHIVRWVNRRPTDRTAAALRKAGLDPVRYGELGALVVLTSGEHGAELFEEYRSVSRKMEDARSPGEWVSVAERLAAGNGGVLQNYRWLRQNGYGGLNAAMRKNPELFSHITQEKKHSARTPEERIKEAERLARGNGGTLQNSMRLEEGGYGWLVRDMCRNPELFKHIPQEKKNYRTSEELVRKAERLATENGGVLQNPRRLEKNDSGLARAMRRNPELFAHIKQKRRDCRTPEKPKPAGAAKAARGRRKVAGGARPPRAGRLTLDDITFRPPSPRSSSNCAGGAPPPLAGRLPPTDDDIMMQLEEIDAEIADEDELAAFDREA